MKKTSLVVSLLLILFAGGVVGETDESNYLWCINEDTPQWKKDIYDSYPDKFKYLKGKYGEYFLLSGYELRIFRFEEKKKSIHAYLTNDETAYWESSEVEVNYKQLKWKGISIDFNLSRSCSLFGCSISYALDRKNLTLNSDETFFPRRIWINEGVKRETHDLDIFQCEFTSKKAVDLAIKLHWKNKSPKNKI